MSIDKKQRESDFVALTKKVRKLSPKMADWMDKEARLLPEGAYYGGGRLMCAFVWSESPFPIIDWMHITRMLDNN